MAKKEAANTGAEHPDDWFGLIPAEPVPHGAPANEQDPKRRIGNFTGAGEPAYKQPGGNNDSHRKAGQRRGSGQSTPKPRSR